MGRGRQKAKHTKVARELKYFSPATNYSDLERELSAAQPSEDERWAEYADKYNDDDEDDYEDDDHK